MFRNVEIGHLSEESKATTFSDPAFRFLILFSGFLSVDISMKELCG